MHCVPAKKSGVWEQCARELPGSVPWILNAATQCQQFPLPLPLLRGISTWGLAPNVHLPAADITWAYSRIVSPFLKLTWNMRYMEMIRQGSGMDQIWSEATDDIKKDSPPPKQTKKTQKDNNLPHGSSWPGSRIEPPPPRLHSLRFDEFRFCHFIEEEAGFARKWSVLFSFLLLTRLLLWSPFQSCLFFQISSTPCDPPL